ncbi:50S ribosomal protein L35 [Candidatus Similichlamydia epinepheli]|uniref:50S ribosomal protein L35 n=1 Tax=Candidatus Similichlamydia epinepheli TaxID=1903953 RepID=UPI000D3A98BA|nr:50S ribosomal protein L35 [Candidatus Similichlamydia epinepheli]
MPKMKTRKAVSEKVRITGTGKLKHARCGRRKFMSSKSPKRKRQLRRPGFVDSGLERVKAAKGPFLPRKRTRRRRNSPSSEETSESC